MASPIASCAASPANLGNPPAAEDIAFSFVPERRDESRSYSLHHFADGIQGFRLRVQGNLGLVNTQILGTWYVVLGAWCLVLGVFGVWGRSANLRGDSQVFDRRLSASGLRLGLA